MGNVRANGIQIEYEAFGEPGRPPLVLIMGLGRQMIHWPQGFIDALVDRGHYAIVFDNRDTGLSSHMDHLGPARVFEALAAQQNGEPFTPRYSLDDMADDTAGLLDALGVESAHIAGVSLGGMIAQAVAIRHPARTRSLISMMSTTGGRGLPPATPEAMAVLLRPPATSRQEYVDQTVDAYRVINPELPMDPAWLAESAGKGYDRAHNPAGVGRQLEASVCQDRTEALGGLTAPTLVLHGTADPLIPLAHGEATAAAISGSTFLPIDRWGHGLPEAVWPTIVDAMSTLIADAESAVRA